MNANEQTSSKDQPSSIPLPKLKKPQETAAGEHKRRVSIDFPLDLWKQAKQAALDREETLRDLVLRGLKAELEKIARGKKPKA